MAKLKMCRLIRRPSLYRSCGVIAGRHSSVRRGAAISALLCAAVPHGLPHPASCTHSYALIRNYPLSQLSDVWNRLRYSLGRATGTTLEVPSTGARATSTHHVSCAMPSSRTNGRRLLGGTYSRRPQTHHPQEKLRKKLFRHRRDANRKRFAQRSLEERSLNFGVCSHTLFAYLVRSRDFLAWIEDEIGVRCRGTRT